MNAHLPPQPWPLVKGYVALRSVGAAILLLVGVAALGAYSWLGRDEIALLLHDRRIWSAPSSISAAASVRGTTTSTKGVFNAHRLKVTFTPPDGPSKTHALEINTLGSDLETTEPATVRLDPAQPDQFALSWAMAAMTSRWAHALVLLILGLAAVALPFLLLARGSWLAARSAVLLSQEGVLAHAHITKVITHTQYGRHTGVFTYEYRLPDDFAGRTGKANFSERKGLPLLLNGDRSLAVLVLAANPRISLALRNDLYPLAFDAETVASIRSQIGA